jgi:hypothetical protein
MAFIVPATIAALLAVAGPNLDTVFLRDGGRLRGTVVEEAPGTGVTVQLVDGELRKVPAADVVRVEYGDGTRGTFGATPAAPPTGPGAVTGESTTPLPPIEPTVPGRAQEAPPETASLDLLAHPGFITFAGALGVAIPTGQARHGLDLAGVTTNQFLLELEGALRVVPALQLGLLLDLGFGRAGRVLKGECDYFGTTCNTTAVNLGVFARYAFLPTAAGTPWASFGLATGILSIDPGSSALQGSAYGGSQWRIHGGYDFRGNGRLGVGLFAGATFGRYSDYLVGEGDFQPLTAPTTHVYVQGGVRAVLFP